MPTILRDLGTAGELSSVVTEYLLASTVATGLWGKLSDLYGRKPVYQCCTAIFLGGSALAGLSQSMLQLILFRGLQGVGVEDSWCLRRPSLALALSRRRSGSSQPHGKSAPDWFLAGCPARAQPAQAPNHAHSRSAASRPKARRSGRDDPWQSAARNIANWIRRSDIGSRHCGHRFESQRNRSRCRGALLGKGRRRANADTASTADNTDSL